MKMYGEMGKASTTLIFSDKPADINAFMAQAGSVLKQGNKLIYFKACHVYAYLM